MDTSAARAMRATQRGVARLCLHAAVDIAAMARHTDGTRMIAYSGVLVRSTSTSRPPKMTRLDHSRRSPIARVLRLRQAIYPNAGNAATARSWLKKLLGAPGSSG